MFELDANNEQKLFDMNFVRKYSDPIRFNERASQLACVGNGGIVDQNSWQLLLEKIYT